MGALAGLESIIWRLWEGPAPKNYMRAVIWESLLEMSENFFLWSYFFHQKDLFCEWKLSLLTEYKSSDVNQSPDSRERPNFAGIKLTSIHILCMSSIRQYLSSARNLQYFRLLPKVAHMAPSEHLQEFPISLLHLYFSKKEKKISPIIPYPNSRLLTIGKSSTIHHRA